MSQWHTRQLLLSPLGTKNGSLADTPDHSVPFWKGASMLVPRSRADKSVCHVYERKEGSCCSKRWGLYCGVHGTSRMLLYHFPETILRGTMPNQDTFHLQLRNHSLHLPLRNVQRSGKNFCGQRTILFQEKQQFLFICTDICTDIFHSWLLSMTLHCGKILQCIPNHPQHEFHEKSRFPCIIRKPEHAVIRYEPAFQSATKQRLDTISAKEETARIFPFCHYHLQTDGYTRTHNGTHSF